VPRKTAILALALLLGGCMSDLFGETAASRWQNPKLPQSQWTRDEEACRKWAAAEAEKEGRRDYAIAADRGEDIGGHAGSYGGSSASQDLKRRRGKLAWDCMKARGYVRVEK
jgi:PBP1b-binding outer membrane lipoprotein LpoB